MDTKRMQNVIRRHSKALEKELESWDRVEQIAARISAGAHRIEPINIRKGINFRFVQMYNPVRAMSLQDEISDLLNAERWAS